MPTTKILAESRARAAAAGLGPEDMFWLDRIGWDDAAVPQVGGAAELADYRRREKALNAAVGHLTFAERAESPEGRLSAALGARAADWENRGEEDDEGA